MGPSLHLQFDHQGVDSTSKCNRGNRQGVIASVDTEVSAEPRPRRRCWLVSDVSRRDVTGRDKVLERVERRQECQAAKIEHFNAMAALSVAQSHCAPRVGTAGQGNEWERRWHITRSLASTRARSHRHYFGSVSLPLSLIDDGDQCDRPPGRMVSTLAFFMLPLFFPHRIICRERTRGRNEGECHVYVRCPSWSGKEGIPKKTERGSKFSNFSVTRGVRSKSAKILCTPNVNAPCLDRRRR